MDERNNELGEFDLDIPEEEAYKPALPGDPKSFDSNDEVIEAALHMIELREKYADLNSMERMKIGQATQKEVEAWGRYWHQCLEATPPEKSSLVRLFRQHRLSQLEREILIALVMERLGLIESKFYSSKQLLEGIHLPRKLRLKGLRCLSEEGRLYRKGLIFHEDPDEDLCDRTIGVEPAIVESVLNKNSNQVMGWPVRKEDDLYVHLAQFSRLFQQRLDIVGGHNFIYRYDGDRKKNETNVRRIDHTLKTLEMTMTNHPDWKIARLFDPVRALTRGDRLILLALAGCELGHWGVAIEALQGEKLAMFISRDREESSRKVRHLYPDNRLMRLELIEPVEGGDPQLCSSERETAGTEFTLSATGKAFLGLDGRGVLRGKEDRELRPPQVRLDQLVLSASVHEALSMGVAQVRHRKMLLDEWGIGEIVPYGRAVTMLFTGPPGTGKTACAEAIAHELDRPLLAVDYPQIMNCYVGQTEKNIKAIFGKARRNGAVLFWDEADAMFFNRSMARQTWEVSLANVLLTQLERFDGVCILASNRKMSMDPALERRISLKVEFERPDRTMRRAIWQKLLPKGLPLHPDVDLDLLCDEPLTGGEIKNVILNAARLGLTRGPGATIAMADFRQTIDFERSGQWCKDGGSKRTIGFCL